MAGVICSVFQYLMEQERECRAVAHTITSNGDRAAEWRKLASGLFEMRLKHVGGCHECQRPDHLS
jgi:hypothetical protein